MDSLQAPEHAVMFPCMEASYLSRSALFLMLLSWLMALLFSMDILAWLARISLLCLNCTY